MYIRPFLAGARSTALALAFALVATLLVAPGASAQTISLDDDPSAPLTSAFVPPFRSAEDEFACGSPAVAAGRVGPSPSLGFVPFLDSDLILNPVTLDIPVLPLDYLDSVSANHRQLTPSVYNRIRLHFSVDRGTGGVGGAASAVEYGLNQAPGDIYASNRQFAHPGFFVPLAGGAPFAGVLPTAGLAGGNFLVFNQTFFGLIPGIAAGLPAPPIAPGRIDNIDAYNTFPAASLDTDGDGRPNFHTFYTYPPAQSILVGFSAADVFDIPPGAGPGFAPPPWAVAPALGLDNFGRDSIDGLVVWNNSGSWGPAWGGNGAVQGVDYALFSLSPCSATLGWLQGLGVPANGGTIFLSDFSGRFAVYAYDTDIGVRSPFGGKWSNVDALEALKP